MGLHCAYKVKVRPSAGYATSSPAWQAVPVPSLRVFQPVNVWPVRVKPFAAAFAVVPGSPTVGATPPLLAPLPS